MRVVVDFAPAFLGLAGLADVPFMLGFNARRRMDAQRSIPQPGSTRIKYTAGP